MFKMASVLFGAQTGSGAEVVYYFDMGENRGGGHRFFNAAPSFFRLIFKENSLYNQVLVVFKNRVSKTGGGEGVPTFLLKTFPIKV